MSDISAQAILQTVTSPSGGLLPVGLGLGEPKVCRYSISTQTEVANGSATSSM